MKRRIQKSTMGNFTNYKLQIYLRIFLKNFILNPLTTSIKLMYDRRPLVIVFIQYESFWILSHYIVCSRFSVLRYACFTCSQYRPKTPWQCRNILVTKFPIVVKPIHDPLVCRTRTFAIHILFIVVVMELVHQHWEERQDPFPRSNNRARTENWSLSIYSIWWQTITWHRVYFITSITSDERSSGVIDWRRIGTYLLYQQKIYLCSRCIS